MSLRPSLIRNLDAQSQRWRPGTLPFYQIHDLAIDPAAPADRPLNP